MLGGVSPAPGVGTTDPAEGAGMKSEKDMLSVIFSWDRGKMFALVFMRWNLNKLCIIWKSIYLNHKLPTCAAQCS